MAYPFEPQAPTVVEDTERALPYAALRCIGANLATGNVDPNVLLANARMLMSAYEKTEAKLLAANRKCAMFEKQFRSWLPTIRRLRKETGGQ